MENRKTMEEDEIDLLELFRTLVKRKWFIVIFTLVAVVYAYMKTPIYEVKALLEIGSYKTSNSNILLDNATQLSRKLNVIFIDLLKNAKDKNAKISSIALPKRATNFIEIKAEGTSNELAIQEVKSVVKYIQANHQNILNDIKKRRELEIRNINTKIKNINTNDLVLIDEEINLRKSNLSKYVIEIDEIEKNIESQKNLNPALAALGLMEKRDINTQKREAEIELIKLKSAKNRLLTTGTSKLLEQKSMLESALLPYNYKNSKVVGKIITNDYAVKPKKKLIVVVAFVTGFILSIFIVFFLEFIQGIKKQDD
jgi:LPS O-antigen subunit length determinant protein (WzzB/FepE family)